MTALGVDAGTLAKLGLAVLLGSLIGLERELRGRPAGLRTMMLVCLGSTMVMIVSYKFSTFAWSTGQQHVVRADPGRIAAGIVTGVGFLGGAVVIKLGDLVRGVTTAAGIWFVASLGIVLGQGHYALAVVATGGALAILWGLHQVERLLHGQVYRTLVVEGSTEAPDATLPEDLAQVAQGAGLRVMDVCIDRDLLAGRQRVRLSVRAKGGFEPGPLLQRVADLPGVTRVAWEPQA